MTEAVLHDWRTAPIEEPLRTTLQLLEKLTLSPADIGPEDAASARSAGVGDEALRDAIYVCALFNLIDRVADALGFHVPPADGFTASTRALLKHGYR